MRELGRQEVDQETGWEGHSWKSCLVDFRLEGLEQIGRRGKTEQRGDKGQACRIQAGVLSHQQFL